MEQYLTSGSSDLPDRVELAYSTNDAYILLSLKYKNILSTSDHPGLANVISRIHLDDADKAKIYLETALGIDAKAHVCKLIEYARQGLILQTAIKLTVLQRHNEYQISEDLAKEVMAYAFYMRGMNSDTNREQYFKAAKRIHFGVQAAYKSSISEIYPLELSQFLKAKRIYNLKSNLPEDMIKKVREYLPFINLIKEGFLKLHINAQKYPALYESKNYFEGKSGIDIFGGSMFFCKVYAEAELYRFLENDSLFADIDLVMAAYKLQNALDSNGSEFNYFTDRYVWVYIFHNINKVIIPKIKMWRFYYFGKNGGKETRLK